MTNSTQYKLESLFTYFLLVFFFFLSISTNIYAVNSCSGTKNYDFSTNNTYSDTDRLTGWKINYSNSYQNYYFHIPSKGSISISLSGGSDVAYRYKFTDCPDYNDGFTNNTFDVNTNDDFNLRVDNFSKYQSRTYTLTVIFTPDTATPPTISNKPISDQTIAVNEDFALDIDATEPDGDDITYAASGLPSGLSIDSNSGLISGVPTTTGTYTVTVIAKDKDGEDSESFTIEVIEVVENADDLCYEDPISSGLMCIDMGICSGGVGCRNTYPLRNIGDSDLSNVKAVYNEDGLGGSFGDSCGVDPSGSCDTVHDIDMGPFGIFGAATEFNLDNTIPPDNNDNSIWTENFISGSCFSGDNLYGSYIKDGVLYRGKLKPCDASDQNATKGYRPFTLRYQTAVYGNMVTVGNTVLVAPDPNNISNCNGYTNGKYIDDAPLRNNYYVLCDFYADPSRPSTSATIDTQIPDPDNSRLVWAGLYWQALTDLSETELLNMTIKIKNENSTGYTDISYDQLDYNDYRITNYTGNNSTFVFSAFADVTQVFKDNNWLNGTFTVADVPAVEGKLSGLGTYGAWTLVLIYENKDEDIRSFSVYDGYEIIDGRNEVNIDIKGFYTPKKTPIESTASFFVAEGDKNIVGDHLYAKPSKKTSETQLTHDSSSDKQAVWSAIYPDFIRTPSPTNNQGIDIQSFELGTAGENIMEPQESEINFRFTTGGDVYWPSMIAFNTELYTPDLCYDYTYGQNGHYITAKDTEQTYIKGTFTRTSPLDVKLYVQNRENSDIILNNVAMRIEDIDTTQAAYKRGSTAITKPGGTREELSDSGREVSDVYDRNITIGTVGSEEYFYTYYSMDLEKSDIDMPINAYIEYDLVIKGVNIGHQYMRLDSMKICRDSGTYLPQYGILNVVHPSMQYGTDPYYYYNLPTQAVDRKGHFLLERMDENDLDKSYTSTRSDILIGALEMIDAEGYHYTDATCTDQNVSLVSNKRIWAIVDEGDYITPLNSDALYDARFFSRALSNAAFRISYNTTADGAPLELEKLSSGEYTITNFPTYPTNQCQSSFVPPLGSSRDIDTWCGDDGAGTDGNGMTLQEVATCMECVYGIYTQPLCSRDNFAIRPESFRMALYDQDQTAGASNKILITKNTDGTSTQNLVAGYNYYIDINATTHKADSSAPGYNASFQTDGENGDRVASLKWNSTKTLTVCNDISDQNKSISFTDGKANMNFNSSNVGEYALNLKDSLWTRVDWDDTISIHQVAPYFKTTQDSDCITNNHDVTEETDSTPLIGCDISSDQHINKDDNSLKYYDINIRYYPYTFNVNGISPQAGPYTRTNGQTFIYMDTPPTQDQNDTDMSYNLNGTFFAAGADGTQLSNFVTNCYADNVQMDIYYNYNTTPPTQPPYLNYSIQELDTINDVIIRPSSGSGLEVPPEPTSQSNPLSIAQASTFFDKDMNGSVTMDLGYNFKRAYNAPINPRYIEFKDFNITDITVNTSSPTNVFANMSNDYKIYGNLNIDSNVTFVYGRAKPNMFFYDNVTSSSIITPVSIVGYCDLGLSLCQNNGMPSIASGLLVNARTNEVNWWFVQNHSVADNDGNITLTASTNGSVRPLAPTALNFIEAINNDVNVSKNSDVATPTIVDIGFGATTNRWLIYNKDKNAIPNIFYRVRFIGGSGSWTGVGQTGHVVDDDINTKKIQRVEW